MCIQICFTITNRKADAQGKKKKRKEEIHLDTKWGLVRVMGLLGGFFLFSIFQNFSNVIYMTFIQILNKNMSDWVVLHSCVEAG